jgi:decaprenylphospho-beta-D-ribofuranose 2-oxidase
MPNGLINWATNASVRRVLVPKVAARSQTRCRRIKPFFFPLDGIRDWNRVYGRRGFVQYQFVVPYGAEAVVRMVLERLSGARTPSFLAVLKRSSTRVAACSFPMAGWTLAVDVPTAGATWRDCSTSSTSWSCKVAAAST